MIFWFGIIAGLAAVGADSHRMYEVSRKVSLIMFFLPRFATDALRVPWRDRRPGGDRNFSHYPHRGE